MASFPEDLSRAIVSVYAAVADGEAWREASRAMASAMGAAHVNVMVTRQLPVVGWGWSFYSDAFADGYDHRDAYFSEGGYVGLSPLRPLVDQRPIGSIVGDDDVGEYAYRNTRFYREFVRPVGLGRVLASHVAMVADGALSMSVYKPPRARPFSARARALFAALQPHVVQALRLEATITKYELTRGTALEALSRAGLGAVFVGPDGRVVVGNQTAEILFGQSGSGIRSDRGRLRPVSAAAEGALARALSACGGADISNYPDIGRPILCRGDVEREPVAMTVLPVRGMAPWIGTWGAITALVLLRDPAMTPVSDSWLVLSELHDLSAAEVRVGRVLANRPDWSTDQVALAVGRSANTVKTHRASLYNKLSIRSQAELVRAVSVYAGV